MASSSSPDAIRPTPLRVRRPGKAEVRSRVLRAAADVFAERGFAAASLDQVAAAAGFTKGAVYSNFAGKDELFLELMADEVARRVGSVERALEDTSDLGGALTAVGAELSRQEAGWQLLFLEFWQRAVRDPEARQAFVAARRALRGRIEAAVERFLSRRPVRPGWDAASLTVVLMALSNGLAVEALPDPDAVPADLLTRVLADLVEPRQP